MSKLPTPVDHQSDEKLIRLQQRNRLSDLLKSEASALMHSLSAEIDKLLVLNKALLANQLKLQQNTTFFSQMMVNIVLTVDPLRKTESRDIRRICKITN